MFDIGSSLRDARLRQELDFPELEELTKVRPKYLRALEDERFDILPAPTYVKGFLRTYADALGLDPQPFVDEYNSRFAVSDEDAAPIRSRQVPVKRQHRPGRESRRAVLALLAIAVVTALVIAAWRFGGPERETVPGLAAQGQSGATPAVSPASTRVRLVVVAARGASWMEVRAGAQGGRLVYRGTLEKGQRKAFQAQRLRVALARPQNVAVRMNGNRVALPAGSTFVVTAQRIVPAS
ncbi:MAG TPA: RodZ domain-containing protein [Gaiellaceae bacterium]|nr:RodZ domain-containing protein [Gaiellaceae bacterium]